MQRVLVNMQNFVLGEAIEQVLKNTGDFHIAVVEDPTELSKKQFNMAATIVLMEVTRYMPYCLKERMQVRNEIKKNDPNCKIVLMVDENADGKTAQQIKQLKRDGLIDQFLYGSISAAYLSAILDTL
ncbi:MAG: hypothetical protein GX786_04570 [Clostridiales bacterium]|nr:hypothetical protein [Clostridiales bacterium]